MSLAARDEYTDFIDGVRRLTQIDLEQYKRGQMERRIRTFVTREGHSDLNEYRGVLKRRREELDKFLDRVTINVSQLWRNPEQWSVIERRILPELAEQGRVRAWSAGCSYGAEAYTLAAICCDRKVNATIQGTDIDQRMVDLARRGRFSAEDGRDAPPAALRRHFTQDGTSRLANAELKRLVRFSQGDLLRIAPKAGSYDLILCRNTVIYFNEPVRDALHERLVGALRPGGVLVVGSTERVSGATALGLESPMPFIYRKKTS
jgi:chemotaxis protein methyltransferase CheR